MANQSMKLLAPTVAFVATIVFSGAIPAIDSTSASEGSPADIHSPDIKDWSETHLSPNSALREQIARAKAFLDADATGIDSEISRLKTEGVLDRRSTSKIRSALDHAHHSVVRLEKNIKADKAIDGWTARMISYELGMAADELARQAVQVEAALSAALKIDDGAPDELSPGEGQQQNLVRALKDGSSLLKETARTIVRYLK